MAGSCHRVAALAGAYVRYQSGAATSNCVIRQSVGLGSQDIQHLSNPLLAFVRNISNSDGGETGEWQRLPSQNMREPLQPVTDQGSNRKDEQSAREGQNLAGGNGRSLLADGAAVQSHKTAPFEGSVGSSKPRASHNSEGPVDFGSRLSKISEDDLDNLIAFKNFKGVRGLPPLETILGQDDEQEKKVRRREAERRKQEETKRSRVKQVDELGRAYATGKRKTSIARVWLMEGQGNIIINGKTHDLYFLDMDKRVQLLEPFVITNTLGDFDVKSTVKGGGISGQSGALRHGISKALQLFDPALRPALKSEGMLTRDDRIVERKKPGKAKARKSFQWVKR